MVCALVQTSNLCVSHSLPLLIVKNTANRTVLGSVWALPSAEIWDIIQFPALDLGVQCWNKRDPGFRGGHLWVVLLPLATVSTGNCWNRRWSYSLYLFASPAYSCYWRFCYCTSVYFFTNICKRKKISYISCRYFLESCVRKNFLESSKILQIHSGNCVFRRGK